jgi:hypothetical protein
MTDYSQMLLERLVNHINRTGRAGDQQELTEILQVLEQIQEQAKGLETNYYIKGA